MRKTTVLALIAVFMVVAMAAAQGTNQPQPAPPAYAIKVLAPAAGHKWEEGSSQKVAWDLTPSAAAPDSMQIVLFAKVASPTRTNEVLLTTIFKDNPGTWTWAKVGPAGKNLKLEVRAFFPKKKVVKGSQTFNITGAAHPITVPSPVPPKPLPPVIPVITVKSPNGGEVWQLGATVLIAWTPEPSPLEGTNKTVNIYLSRDGGTTYPELIAKGITFAATEYKYAVTGAASDKCFIKVTVSGSETDAGPDSDVSDGPFRIVSPTGHGDPQQER
jgi:hypothetical protein